jgi:hypothetical protein
VRANSGVAGRDCALQAELAVVGHRLGQVTAFQPGGTPASIMRHGSPGNGASQTGMDCAVVGHCDGRARCDPPWILDLCHRSGGGRCFPEDRSVAMEVVMSGEGPARV